MPTSDHRISQRKKILVDKPSQFYLTFITVAYLVLYTILMLLVVMAPSILKLLRSTSTPTEQYVAGREFLTLGQRALPVVCIFMGAFAVHFIFISNRICGPFHRFKQILREWREGRWPSPFRCRPKDFHEEVFATFNEAVDKLRGDVVFVQDRLRAVMEAAQRSSPETAVAALKNAADECRLALERIDSLHME